jgi:pimeloyl-ACP methyl ester carboxylesterase
MRLGDVEAPVRWWHGDADPIMTFSDAKTAASQLSDAELILLPDECHLRGFAAAEVLGFVRSHL